MAELLQLTALLALAAFSLTEVVRKLPMIELRVLAGVRPWACDHCMSVWSTLAVVAAAGVSGAAFWSDLAMAAAPAAGATLLLLLWIHTLTPPLPPELR